MDQSRINAIRARCEAATPGPWTADLSEGDCGVYSEDCPHRLEDCDDACPQCDRWEILKGGLVDGPDYVECGEYSYFSDNDAEFIAHARTDIPYLLAEVERLTRELEAAKRDMRKDCETCKFAENPANVPPCEECGGYHDEFLGASGWEWRGITENGGAK